MGKIANRQSLAFSEGGSSESKDSEGGTSESRDSEGRDSEARESPHWDSSRDRDSKARDSEVRDSENRDSEATNPSGPGIPKTGRCTAPLTQTPLRPLPDFHNDFCFLRTGHGVVKVVGVVAALQHSNSQDIASS